MFIKKLLPIAATCLLTACASGAKMAFMPATEMNQMGLEAFNDIKKNKAVTTNTRYKRFVDCITSPLIKLVGGKWEVLVFEDKTLNAFALPGNKIGVHTGLVQMVDNQDQLAAVIGHEIGHVLAEHSNQRMSQDMVVKQGLGVLGAVVAPQTALGQLGMSVLGIGAQYGVLLPFSRSHESESDVIGLDLMAKAGFDPRQSTVLWQKMGAASQGAQPPEFMSTHPAHGTRIQELNNNMPQAMQKYQQAQAAGQRPNCRK